MLYKNPVIKGFNPDPSVCRGENSFFLVTSSFEYFPAIPIYQSFDLVNWKQIGNVISREGMLPFSSAKSSGGVWAATIRRFKNRFYVTATFYGAGNFITSSPDPCGEWTKPVWVNIKGIDPSLYREDGKTYFCSNSADEEGIVLAEIDPDTGEILSEPKIIWRGEGGGFLEAPHIYKKDGFYYLLTAEGGTWFNHCVCAARSAGIFGPYESCPSNPILTSRADASKRVACAGHGDLIEDFHGNWFMVHLATRPVGCFSHLGRETFLTPIVWRDAFPYVSGGMARLESDAPLLSAQSKAKRVFSMDFSTPEFKKECIFLREPVRKNYKKDGALHIKPSGVKLKNGSASPSFVAVRQLDFCCTAEAEFSFSPSNDGSAGVVLYLSEKYFYFFGKSVMAAKAFSFWKEMSRIFTTRRFPRKSPTEKSMLK